MRNAPRALRAAALAECNRTLAEHKRVAAWLVWNEEFPRTASQKLKRGVLAEQIRDKVAADALLEAS